MGALAASLLLCQCYTDAPPASGTLKLVDPEAQEYWKEAQECVEQKDWSGAISRYKKLCEYHALAEEAPAARFHLAQLYELTDDPREAFDTYQKVIERYPNSPLYSQALKAQKELAFKAARGELTSKVLWSFDVPMDPSDVIRWLNSVCQNAPYSEVAPEAMYLLGEYLVKRERTQEAIETFQKLVDNYPTSPYAPVAQLEVADLYRSASEKGDRNNTNIMRAQEAYEAYLSMFPNHAKSAQAKSGLNDIRRQLVQQKLEIGEYYMNRMKNLDAAVFCFQETASMDHINPEAAAKAKEYLKELGSKVQ